ncbi:MAG: ATP-binding protein [Bacteroidaceae bacterium]|nr:ATP-binding protein [Bacteroidaceae bacterium]
MEKYADYIRRIEIMSLWSGRNHIVWQLRPDVNILSGVNGVGKSTILNKIISQLRHRSDKIKNGSVPGVQLEFAPDDATGVRFDIIRSFDNGLIPGSLLAKIGDENIRSELDWKLYELQRRYLDYQVNVGNRMIELLTSGSPDAQEQAMKASQAKTRFQDLIDELFQETRKKINRSSNELQFLQYGEKLPPYALSSGEKQMLVILLTVLLQDGKNYVLFMDEPEVSLHIEWQERLINIVRSLNSNAQIILTTHSPAVVMNGWTDAVTEVTDITLQDG